MGMYKPRQQQQLTAQPREIIHCLCGNLYPAVGFVLFSSGDALSE
jgi:hypothetical protein